MAVDLLQIGDPRAAPARGLRPFACGFRPLFLGAGLYAAVAMVLWTLAYRGAAVPGADAFWAPHWWHGHAMVFGYAHAVIAGFLLTAVQNWTGATTAKGGRLAVLTGLWLAGRILPHLGQASIALGADLAFGAGVLLAITVPLVRARRWTDLAPFGPLLVALGAGNLWFFAGAPRRGLLLGVYAVVGVLLVVAARVYPFFVEKGVPGEVSIPRRPWLSRALLAALVAFAAADLSGLGGAAPLALLVAALASARLLSWLHPGFHRRALLWVLVAGYAWLALGFALLGAERLGWLATPLGLHAITVGGVGMVTVGMMSRVSLGHTGRDLYARRPALGVCFGFALAATALRLSTPVLPYATAVQLAQLAWVVTFALFVWVYAPMLLRPRVDGKDG